MKILVCGCVHSQWDLVCSTVESMHAKGNNIDLVLVTGDAGTFRTKEDLESANARKRNCEMGSFGKFYNGERRMPVLTLVIGGNHEASDVFHLLPFGGWLAENIFYVGRAAGLAVGDVKFAFVSGLDRPLEYYSPVNETYPIRSQRDKATSYYIRAFSDFQVYGLSGVDIVGTHDWPAGIPFHHGNAYLRRRKADLVKDDEDGKMGLSKGLQIMEKLKPKNWYSAHHHVQFEVSIGGTAFNALAKTGQGPWYKVRELANATMGSLRYCGEWISILKATSAEMEDPSILKTVNWDDHWAALKPSMVACEDCDVGSFTTDLFSYTSDFCTTHGIFCPVAAIREHK